MSRLSHRCAALSGVSSWPVPPFLSRSRWRQALLVLGITGKLRISNPRHNLVSIHCCVEFEALQVTCEQVYEEAHYGWPVTDNKGTNI